MTWSECPPSSKWRRQIPGPAQTHRYLSEHVLEPKGGRDLTIKSAKYPTLIHGSKWNTLWTDCHPGIVFYDWLDEFLECTPRADSHHDLNVGWALGVALYPLLSPRSRLWQLVKNLKVKYHFSNRTKKTGNKIIKLFGIPEKMTLTLTGNLVWRTDGHMIPGLSF